MGTGRSETSERSEAATTDGGEKLDLKLEGGRGADWVDSAFQTPPAS